MLRATSRLIPALRQQQQALAAAQNGTNGLGQLLGQQDGQAQPQSGQQFRFIGGDKIPEFWGKPSAYTDGTAFLGTPADHLQSLKKRPLSPDVIDIDGKHTHYKFPWGALSSITNRVTGVVLSVGTVTAATLALRGSLGGTVESLAATHSLLLFPFKFAVLYVISYHWLGGIRHVLWDHHKIGNQADKTSLLELPAVELSSKALFAVAAALSFVGACL